MNEQNDIITPETTETQITDSQYFKILKEYKNFKGRTNQKDYWLFTLINLTVSLILSFFSNSLVIIFQLLIFLPSLAISVRRLHDVNKESWYLLIPGYNLILLLKKGTGDKELNKYTSSVAVSDLRIEVLFVLMFLTLLFSILKFIVVQQQIKNNPNQKETFYISDNNGNNQTELEKINQQSLQEVEQAQTLEEVIQAYQNARQGSQAKLDGAIKWISFCQTSQQIKEASRNFAENSQASIAALEKWKELSQKELKQAQTIEDFKNIYENAPDDNDLKSAIYNKWNEVSLEQAEQIQTVLEAKNAYGNSPVGSQSRTKILEKWSELAQQEIDQAQSFQNMQNLYKNLPENNSSLNSQAITKWVSLSQATYQAKEVYLNTTRDSNDQILVLEKWSELAKQEIEQAQNFQDIKNTYNNLPNDNSLLTNSALPKWISFCQTYQEAKEVYSSISSNYINYKEEALNKWNSLALEAIQQAQTIEALQEIYNNTPENSTSRKTAFEKMKELN